MSTKNFGAASKLVSVASLIGIGGIFLFASTGVEAQGGTITAQSAMVDIQSESSSYQIDGSITWTYSTATAETYFTNTLTSGPVVTTGTGAAPATPAAPAPQYSQLTGWLNNASGPKCTFWSGGALPSKTYTQTVTLPKGWKYTYTYTIAPSVESVDAQTAWTSEETGGSVTLNFAGFVAGESFMKNGTKTKYSFTMVDSGVTRVRGLSAALSGPETGVADLSNVDTDGDLVNDGTAVGSATVDFGYVGNGGLFGNATAQLSLLDGLVSSILTSDNFANNNNDLASGNVQVAPYSASFPGITQAGDYSLTVSGSIKGNSAAASQAFTVTSNIVTIGGC